MMRTILLNHEPAPEPVILPDNNHLLNWDILRFWQEKVHEHGHDHHPEAEKQKESEFQVAEHH